MTSTTCRGSCQGKINMFNIKKKLNLYDSDMTFTFLHSSMYFEGNGDMSINGVQ